MVDEPAPTRRIGEHLAADLDEQLRVRVPDVEQAGGGEGVAPECLTREQLGLQARSDHDRGLGAAFPAENQQGGKVLQPAGLSGRAQAGARRRDGRVELGARIRPLGRRRRTMQQDPDDGGGGDARDQDEPATENPQGRSVEAEQTSQPPGGRPKQPEKPSRTQPDLQVPCHHAPALE